MQPSERVDAIAPRRLSRWAVTFAKVAISLGLIVALSFWIDWASVGQVLRTARAPTLLVAVGVIGLTVPLSSWRWSRCAAACGVQMPQATFLRATYASLFVGQFLPSGIGVDAARTGFLVHRGANLGPVLRSVALDRVLGVGSMIFVMATGLPWIWPRLPGPLRLLAALLVVAAAAGVILVMLAGRLRAFGRSLGNRHVVRVLEQGWAVRDASLSRDALIAFGASVGIYCTLILGVLWIAAALDIHVRYVALLAIVSLAIFVSLLPISINGWGVREGAMVAGLYALGVAREHALAVSLLFGFINAVVTLPGAFVWHGKRAAAPSNGRSEN